MGVTKRAWTGPDGKPRVAWRIKKVVRLPDGRTQLIRKTAEGRGRREAKAEEDRLVAAALDGTYGRREGVPGVAELAAEFLKATPGLLKPSTHRWYADQLNRVIVPALGSHAVDEIHGRVLDEFRAGVSEGRSVETVRGTLRVLRRLLGFAAERKYMVEAPKVKLPRNTTVRDLPRFFTFQEADALVAAAGEDPEWGPLVIVALRTGLRISELLALRWADVELTGTPRINVTRGVVDGFESAPKSGKGRPVPLSAQACSVLKAHRARNPKAKLVFGNPGDTRRTRHQATHAIHRLCDAAEVERAGIHTTRHTFASHLAMRGVPPVQIRDLLGHASIQQTEVYARLQPGHGSAAAVALLDGSSKPAGVRR